MLSTAKRSQEK